MMLSSLPTFPAPPSQLTGDHVHVYNYIAANALHGGDPEAYLRQTLMLPEQQPLTDVDIQHYAWNHMRSDPRIVDQFHQQFPDARLDNVLANPNSSAQNILEFLPPPIPVFTQAEPPVVEFRMVNPTTATPVPQVGAGKHLRGAKTYTKPKPRVGAGDVVLISVNPSPALLKYPKYQQQFLPREHQFVTNTDVWKQLQNCDHITFPPQCNPWPGIEQIKSVLPGTPPVTYCLQLKADTNDPTKISQFLQQRPKDEQIPPEWVIHSIRQDMAAKTSGGKIPKMTKKLHEKDKKKTAKVSGGYSMRGEEEEDANSRMAAIRMGFADPDSAPASRSAADELGDMFGELSMSEQSKAKKAIESTPKDALDSDPGVRRILSSRRY